MVSLFLNFQSFSKNSSQAVQLDLKAVGIVAKISVSPCKEREWGGQLRVLVSRTERQRCGVRVMASRPVYSWGSQLTYLAATTSPVLERGRLGPTPFFVLNKLPLFSPFVSNHSRNAFCMLMLLRLLSNWNMGVSEFCGAPYGFRNWTYSTEGLAGFSDCLRHRALLVRVVWLLSHPFYSNKLPVLKIN